MNFMCSNGARIPISKISDGKSDCPDASDEHLLDILITQAGKCLESAAVSAKLVDDGADEGSDGDGTLKISPIVFVIIVGLSLLLGSAGTFIYLHAKGMILPFPTCGRSGRGGRYEHHTRRDQPTHSTPNLTPKMTESEVSFNSSSSSGSIRILRENINRFV